jgi:hypothetical protein
VDVGVGLTVLGSAEVSKDAIVRILGPTADYIGEGVRGWTERRVGNVQRVFKKAHDKLGSELDRPGAVPPRVLKAVLEEAQFAEDELVAEYLGGVLASSRSEVGRDDRSAASAATVGRLSTYAIRTHFVFYAAARPLFTGVDFRSGIGNSAAVFVGAAPYCEAMDFSEQEETAFNDLIAETMLSLSREDLIEPQWTVGDPEGLRRLAYVDAPETGIVFRLSKHGIVLFCTAQGVRDNVMDYYVASPGSRAVAGIQLPEALIVRELPPFPAAPAPGPEANPSG